MTNGEVYQHYIGGEWTDGTGDETFESENPATGETLGEFRRGTPEDVDAALAAADDAYEEWKELSQIDRAEYLWDIYQELKDRHEELGEVVTKECGKEISEGKADVTEAWHMVEWAAGDARHRRATSYPPRLRTRTPTCGASRGASWAVSRRGTSRSPSRSGTWPSRWSRATRSSGSPPSRRRGVARSSPRCSRTPASRTACST